MKEERVTLDFKQFMKDNKQFGDEATNDQLKTMSINRAVNTSKIIESIVRMSIIKSKSQKLVKVENPEELG